MYKIIRDFEPHIVVLDPITNFISVGTYAESKSMLIRLMDFLKANSITGLFTSLTFGGGALRRRIVRYRR